MTEQTQEERRAERKKKRAEEKQAAKGTPVAKKNPIGMMIVKISTVHPHDPDDMDTRVDMGGADPIAFEIYPDTDKFKMPDGMLKSVRESLEGCVALCRTYKPDPNVKDAKTPEENLAIAMAKPKNELLLTLPPANDDVLITGGDPAPGAQRPTFTVPDGPTEVEQGICQRCGWREMECGCEEGYLAPEADHAQA